MGVFLTAIKTADIEIGKKGKMIQSLDLAADAETAQLRVRAAVAAICRALHTIRAARRRQVAGLPLRPQLQAHLLNPRILGIVALGVKKLEAVRQGLAYVVGRSWLGSRSRSGSFADSLAEGCRARHKGKHREHVPIYVILCRFC